MGEGCGSWFPQQQFDWRSPVVNSLAASHPLVQRSTNPQLINSGCNMVSITGTLPGYANPEIPQLKVGQVNEPRGWFYCSPCFQQGLAPASNASLKEQLPANPFENHTEKILSKDGSGCAQKRYLVFDQSGDQTTLIFSSAFRTPIKCTSWGPKSPSACNFNGQDLITKVNPNLHSGPISTNVFDENGTDVQSEMHEDTEELNALLYSDDDSYYTDDGVTNAVHSPSTMTARDEQFKGGTEKVASSTGLTKKRKLLDGCNDYVPLLMDTDSSGNPNRCSEYVDDADSSCANGQNPVFGDTESSSGNKRMRMLDKIRETVPSLMDTDSSVNPNRFSEYTDDADSSCANGQNPVSGDINSSSGKKRMRMDKIRKTVSVLRSLIPSGEGKDAIMVLDEAIDYLKSLKLKAKALGLSTL